MVLMRAYQRNDLDAWEYVKDVLDRLLAGCTNFESLRPDVWAATHPDSIRTYRVEERRQQQSARRDRDRLRRRLSRLDRPEAT